ncbi:hypothetical protein CHS0354_018716 [Potamilus streckersoni]|uniref:Uncharacterized protein n=1 Tax=Potamilus streckersoni TaxID=2493646 RepID=A0AAE0RQF2_9BIVA|nr:hypothetical protein CHS0354_018716 [Potamilus streckersoni]
MTIVRCFLLLCLYLVDCFSAMSAALPLKCIYDGRYFQPGEEISREKLGSWCFGSYCNEDGDVISWDDWNCNIETPTINLPTTQQPGCFTGDRWIQPGEVTFEGRNGSWCLCNADGSLTSWDDWDCS